MSEPKYDVFLSYSRAKAATAKELADALTNHGLRVWHDAGQLRIGDSALRGIEDGLEESRCFLLLISPQYFQEQWSSFEMGVALSRAAEGDRIIPVIVGDTHSSDFPFPVGHLNPLYLKNQSVDEVAAKVAEILAQDPVQHPA